MADCVIVSHAVFDQHYYGAPARAVSICETHKFPVTISTISHEPLKCPIGRIEEALEEAVKQINAAKAS